MLQTGSNQGCYRQGQFKVSADRVQSRLLWTGSNQSCYGQGPIKVAMEKVRSRLLWTGFNQCCYGIGSNQGNRVQPGSSQGCYGQESNNVAMDTVQPRLLWITYQGICRWAVFSTDSSHVLSRGDHLYRYDPDLSSPIRPNPVVTAMTNPRSTAQGRKW